MTAGLTELNEVVAEFPPEMVRKVIDYAIGLKQWQAKPPVDEIGWTEADYRTATAASMRYYDELYPEDEGYGAPSQAR